MDWWSPPPLLCYLTGEYAGFDESQPTAESGGKGKVISILKEQYGFKTVVMIGDGATDLEACPPAVSVGFEWMRCVPVKQGFEGCSSIVVLVSLTERLYWIWRERGQAAGEGAVLLVRDRFRGADRRTGKDLKMQYDCY